MATPRPTQAQTPARADSSGQADFVVLLRGTRIGSETVTVNRAGGGWVVQGSSRLGAPLDVVTNSFEMRYDSDWQPQRLALDGSQRGQPITITSSFGLTTAMTDVTQGQQHGSASQQITARSIVLFGNFFSAYEAVALRLTGAAAGSRFPVFAAPEGDATLTVTRVAPRRVSLGDASIELLEYSLTLTSASATVPLELWVDPRGRLARLVLPTASMVVLREEFASVLAREERVRHPGDEDAFVPANGFSLGATVSRPAAAGPGRRPAVVLVGGPGPQDRDMNVFGVPIFGQLAGVLADQGHIVVRFDPRGVGQSGGRTENAGLVQYAEDVLQVVGWVRRRKDVDGDRIALIAYGDGAPVALSAAAREKRIKGLALLAAPGRTGREVTLERQQQLLSGLPISDTDRRSRIGLQNRVIDAAITGKGWDALPRDVRDQADSPWFRSWLLFDPATALLEMKQPVLVLSGSLDRELNSAHADRLTALATSRKNASVTLNRRVTLEGVNHLLVPAITGDPGEYATLESRTLSPAAGSAVAEWLTAVFATR